jgi:hypothetical protein
MPNLGTIVPDTGNNGGLMIQRLLSMRRVNIVTRWQLATRGTTPAGRLAA